jgi:hypothetical protein
VPYIIRPPFRRTLAALAGVLVVSAAPAMAEPTSPSECAQAALSQPFLYAKDTNWYTLAPGQTPGSFNGLGWQLSGRASVVSTTAAGGGQTSVLNLPSGSKAVSPLICVNANYPDARTMVRNVAGSEGVFFDVSYQGTATQNKPKNTGQVHGSGSAWTLSGAVNLQPANTGWQLVRITLIPGGSSSDFQVYNLYIDPYSR